MSATTPAPENRRPRHAAPRRSNVEGNARLTASTAAVLFILFAIEGVTILRIGQLLTLHIIIGMLLVPPVMLKMSSTTWRFARYYLGDPAYKEKGPPHPILRVLGPFVVILTVVLFASGIALFLAPSSWHSKLLLLHRGSFIVWIAVMTIHVLGHLAETGRFAALDWIGGARRRLAGAGWRRLALVVALAAGAVLAVILAGHVNVYRSGRAR
jgi:hypothetical protein